MLLPSEPAVGTKEKGKGKGFFVHQHQGNHKNTRKKERKREEKQRRREVVLVVSSNSLLSSFWFGLVWCSHLQVGFAYSFFGNSIEHSGFIRAQLANFLSFFRQ